MIAALLTYSVGLVVGFVLGWGTAVGVFLWNRFQKRQ